MKVPVLWSEATIGGAHFHVRTRDELVLVGLLVVAARLVWDCGGQHLTLLAQNQKHLCVI